MTSPELDCDATGTYILDYVDERLDVETRRLVCRHLDGCAQCSRFVHDVTKGLKLLRSIPYNYLSPRVVHSSVEQAASLL